MDKTTKSKTALEIYQSLVDRYDNGDIVMICHKVIEHANEDELEGQFLYDWS